MNRPGLLIAALLFVVGAFAGKLTLALGWHWLASWPVFGFSFVGLIFVAVALREAGLAFVAGFKRGWNRTRGGRK
ncbi:hypothetical protein RCMEACHAM_49 [Rhodobacter phage RcMeacham]|nr:hypothetical protein RCMEACHAM_49 [Rhodobacter phage RcMeacham]